MSAIEYFTIEELPDRPMFRCGRRLSTMQVSSCADMWKQANERGAPERLDLCRNCVIGAKHAGVEEISLSPLRGSSICARCHTGTTRLIRGHLCPSCMNRQYEYEKGRNAKGAVPVNHPTLYPLRLKLRTDGRVIMFERGKVVGTHELVIAALRDQPKQVTFSFSGTKPKLVQEELF